MTFACAAVLIATLSVFAALVPKELRKAPLSGNWEITTSNVWGAGPSDQYNGQRWCLADSGTFSITESKHTAPLLNGSFRMTTDGLEILFGEVAIPAKSLFESEGDTMRLANPKKNGARPPDLKPSADTVIYTFKRVKD